MVMRTLLALVTTFCLSSLSLFTTSKALDNGAALRPPLGWSTWQTCGDAHCSHDACNEDEVKSVARNMASKGLVKLGYRFVNLDDCWLAAARNSTNGELRWDDARFPSGIPALAAWLHERSLKLGIYTSVSQARMSGNCDCTHTSTSDRLARRLARESLGLEGTTIRTPPHLRLGVSTTSSSTGVEISKTKFGCKDS